jgi:hypothetical protein
MKRLVLTIAAACLTTGCFGSGSGSGPDNNEPDTVRVPGSSQRTMGGMTFTRTGPTAQGSAEVVNAYISDYDYLPLDDDGYANGSMSITVGEQQFVNPGVDAVWDLIIDEDGEQYIGIAGVEVREDYYGVETMDHLVIIVPHSEVEPGATVELDGVRSFALFASGDPYYPPSVYGAAVSGTVTFDSLTGSDPDQLIGATIEADFGAAEPDFDAGMSGDPRS